MVEGDSSMRLTRRGRFLADTALVLAGFLGGVYLLHITRYLPETAFLFSMAVWLGTIFWIRRKVN